MINNIDLISNIGNAYKQAYPFPHTVIDNFFNDYLLSRAKKELDNFNYWHYDPNNYVVNEQVNKEFAPYSFDEESMRNFKTNLPTIDLIIEYLCSKEVLEYLEELTGIQELVADPDLMGGGVHRIHQGGKLDIHADFNFQPARQMWRRINLLLYLNKDWQEEWGGHLELWDRDMSKCCVKIAPIFNRVAIFNITDDAYHGHPHPMTSPYGVTRDSIALYYYTADRPEHEKSPYHPVLWQKI